MSADRVTEQPRNSDQDSSIPPETGRGSERFSIKNALIGGSLGFIFGFGVYEGLSVIERFAGLTPTPYLHDLGLALGGTLAVTLAVSAGLPSRISKP